MAILEITRQFRTDFWLAQQMNDSAESVMSNIAEGFGQLTDRGFARYLGISAGSVEESRAHLLAAELGGHIPPARSAELRSEAGEIGKMLNALIVYLHRSDRKNRLVR